MLQLACGILIVAVILASMPTLVIPPENPDDIVLVGSSLTPAERGVNPVFQEAIKLASKRMPIHFEQFNSLIPANAQFEVLSTGFKWVEGPVWVSAPSNSYLLFSEIPSNTVYRLREVSSDGESSWETGVFLTQSGLLATEDKGNWKEPGSNGLLWDHYTNTLVLCEHGNRRVSRLSLPAHSSLHVDQYAFLKEPLATQFQGKRFNSPNDLVMTEQRSLIFTDPSYGLQVLPGFENEDKQREDHPDREQDINAVYILRTSQNYSVPVTSGTEIRKVRYQEPALLTDKVDTPNGIALSPDGQTLYIGDSANNLIVAFELDPESEEVLSDSYRVVFDFEQARQVMEQSDEAQDIELINDWYKNWLDHQKNRDTSSSSSSSAQYASIHPWSSFPELFEGPGCVDGFVVDKNGIIFTSGAGGLYLIEPSGQLLGKLEIGRETNLDNLGEWTQRISNLAWGDDGYLYLTYTDQVLRIMTNTGPANRS